GGFRKSARVNADVFERAQLVVGNRNVRLAPAVIMHFVQLGIGEPENKIGGATVAGHAFGAARITPEVLSLAAGGAGLFDDNCSVGACCGNERGIGLAFIPTIGVSDPLAGFPREEPSFNACT